MTMAGLFGQADLRRVAGERSSGRGPGYLDPVGDLEIGVDQVTATVYGTEVAALLTKIRDCHQRLGTAPQFAVFLAALRADQKRKRNLIKLLNQRGL